MAKTLIKNTYTFNTGVVEGQIVFTKWKKIFLYKKYTIILGVLKDFTTLVM
jgi:hypothetical protein